jgi:hypothetical protein
MMLDKLQEVLIKYRKAVTTSSPGLPPGYPGYPSQRASTPMGLCPLTLLFLPNVAAERQRWAGGRYRFAV